MAPQKFDDLGKAASDLFSKNFHSGNYKAEFNTKSSEGIDITVKGNQNAAGNLSSSVEGKFKLDCGAEVKKTWNAGGKDMKSFEKKIFSQIPNFQKKISHFSLVMLKSQNLALKTASRQLPPVLFHQTEAVLLVKQS